MPKPHESLLFQPNAAGRLSVGLAYPNRYQVAMGNLGYQAVYRILATTPGVYCDRLFLGDGGRGLASGRPAGDFDVLAFSVSFESDYPNIVRMLDAAGIPARAADRRASRRNWPVLLGGGPATFLNPEPIAPFFDLFLLGEAEEMLPEALAGVESWPTGDAERTVERLASVAGAYRPDLAEPFYGDDGGFRGVRTAGESPLRVTRRYVSELDRYPTMTSVLAPSAVFGDYFLVEASRGCEWGCRFCAAGFMYRPVRHRSGAGVSADALAGLKHARTIGLVGAEMASHPAVASTCERVSAAGGRVSPSSLKADMISPRLARALGASGTRSVTVAPEAGSERMRRVINKNLSEAEILRAVDLMVGDGVDSLKLYFMCGLPTETEADLEAIVELTARIRDRMLGHARGRGRIGKIKASVNPFVPKPWTPFQWEPMQPVADLQARIARLRTALKRVGNVEMEAESPREAYLQTLLSRGDRRVASVVESLARSGEGTDARMGWWQQLQRMRREGCPGMSVSPDYFVTRSYEESEPLPWDFIDHAVDKRYLALERRRALAERETEPCDVATCRTCGAC